MLSKEVFKREFQKLVYVYPNWRFQFDSSEAVQAAYSYFKELKDEEFEEMVTNYIINEKFPPSIASLYEYKGYNLQRRISEIMDER